MVDQSTRASERCWRNVHHALTLHSGRDLALPGGPACGREFVSNMRADWNSCEIGHASSIQSLQTIGVSCSFERASLGCGTQTRPTIGPSVRQEYVCAAEWLAMILITGTLSYKLTHLFERVRQIAINGVLIHRPAKRAQH